MNFTFNMGGMDYTSVVIEICKKHKSCDDCPVMQNGNIKINDDFGNPIQLSCSTAIIRNLQNGKR